MTVGRGSPLQSYNSDITGGCVTAAHWMVEEFAGLPRSEWVHSGRTEPGEQGILGMHEETRNSSSECHWAQAGGWGAVAGPVNQKITPWDIIQLKLVDKETWASQQA